MTDMQRDNLFYVPKRYIFTVLGFGATFNVYAMRTCLSVTIVAMVNNTAQLSINATNSELEFECPDLLLHSPKNENEKSIGRQYDWDAHTQGLILGAFYCGYIVPQLSIDFLSEKVGAKWLVGGGVLNTAIFNLLTPLVASWGATALIIARAIQGLGEGTLCPSLNLMISQWSPVMERSRISTIIFIGMHIGITVSMAISGWLITINILGGWPSVFYLLGTISCVWFVLWAILVYENPAVHPTISLEERLYIQPEINQKPKTPWKSILTSLPLWALVIANTGFDVGLLILIADLPTYLSSILHFNIKDNGLLSAIPFLFQAVSACVASYIADRLRKSGALSITNIRKLCNAIGSIGPALCILVITVSGCRPYLITLLFVLAMTFNGFVFSGYNVTHVDMSPTFAGTLYAITNTIGSIFGFIGPAIVGALTEEGETIANWNSVFYIVAGTYIVSEAFFTVFASAELQPWETDTKGSKS